MKLLFLTLLILGAFNSVFAQDLIYRHNGNTISCKIEKVEDSKIIYTIEQNSIPTTMQLKLKYIKYYKIGSNKEVYVPLPGIYGSAENKGRYGLSAGDELQLFATHMYVGFGLVTAGAVVGGFAFEYNSDGTALIAGVLMLTGAILQLESFSHAYKAGRIMNAKERTTAHNYKLKPSKRDIGIALAF